MKRSDVFMVGSHFADMAPLRYADIRLECLSIG